MQKVISTEKKPIKLWLEKLNKNLITKEDGTE